MLASIALATTSQFKVPLVRSHQQTVLRSNENTDSGNLVNVDPQFENVTNLDNFNFTFNYRLKTGSPARNAATNGTDLGIYAAPYPFPSGGAPGSGFDTSALPPIPQVTEMTIQNATVQPGAPLNVNVKARVNN
jgi:hypothetical protein